MLVYSSVRFDLTGLSEALGCINVPVVVTDVEISNPAFQGMSTFANR